MIPLAWGIASSGCCELGVQQIHSGSAGTEPAPVGAEPPCPEDVIGEQLTVCFTAAWQQGLLGGDGEIGRGREDWSGMEVVAASATTSSAPYLARQPDRPA